MNKYFLAKMNMNSAVCTLFENHYHKGVAALTNSLYQNGFRGSIYAGYRGNLPHWASRAEENPSLQWPGSSTLKVSDGLELHFLPLSTEYHLTNYKPVFMLRLLNGPSKAADGIAYFDPDIVVKCSWYFYENWMTHGVALVHEIVHNDKPPTHPIRLEWEKIIQKSNRYTTRQLFSYINGGFCGVSRKNIEFLQLWASFINTAIEEYKADPNQIWSYDKTYPFCFLDQDALNIAAMCSNVPLSEIGPEGMDFIHGGWTMSHAVGSLKPWKKNFILSAFKGLPPSLADRMFWTYVSNPINNHSSAYISFKRISILLAAFIGRFYRRG